MYVCMYVWCRHFIDVLCICDEKQTIIELFWHAWQGPATLVGASIGDVFHMYML